MTNPNNAVGTNGAFGGRTSVNAFNDVLGTFRSRGILSGWGISASSGMTVNVGGNGTTRDVAVAEDANGNKTTINNISASPIAITLDSAPASNSRYDAIVAYVDKPPIGSATQDNPECCGIIPVTGTAASTPTYPDDGTIRSAITADGASGSTAYYVVLGYILVASGTTTITSGMITSGSVAQLAAAQVDSVAIANSAVTSQKIDWTTLQSVVQSTFTALGNAAPGSKNLSCTLQYIGNGFYLFFTTGDIGCKPTTSNPHIGYSIPGYTITQSFNCSIQFSNASAFVTYQTQSDFWMTSCDTTHNLSANIFGICKAS